MRVGRTAQLIGVAILIAGNLILGYLAFHHPAASSTSSARPPASIPTTPAATTSTTAPPTIPGTPLTQMVVGVDATHAWRVTTGTCATGGATVALTKDAGATWRQVTSPVKTVARIQPSSASDAFVVGATSKSCSLGVQTTANGGKDWAGPTSVTGAWARDIAEPAKVHVPGGATPAPCAKVSVVDLSRVDASRAYVLCADGRVQGTTDAGKTWKAAGTVPGGVALVTDAAHQWVLTTGTAAGCTGVAIETLATSPKRAGCIAVGSAKIAAGTVSGSMTGKATWVTVGAQTFVSTDQLKSWQASAAG